MVKSVALIGGGGFIGTNLANFFIEKGYNVLIIGRSLDEGTETDTGKTYKANIDVNNTLKLVDALNGYDNVIWLVSDLVPSASMDRLVDDFNFNVSPLINFLGSIDKLNDLKRFVFMSSGGTIYGDSPNHILLNEDFHKNPISAYGLSKIISENYINFISKRSSFESIILRPSNVYGNHQNFKKPQGIVGYAFNALLNNKSIDLYDEGMVVRDFIHVLDLAEAVKCCIEKQHEGGRVETYNVGSQEGYTIRTILDLISEISSKNIKTISKPGRSFDCAYNVLDITKINTEFGWEPKIKLKEGLEQVWICAKSELQNDKTNYAPENI
jgi:UDP-glucose 4-epimerase